MNLRQLALLALFAGILTCSGTAQETKQWTVSQYDAMERGEIAGIAIRSDGQISAGPATSLLYQTPGNFVWTVAADKSGSIYAGMGGTTAGDAVVTRISTDGKTQTKIFAGKELGVQAIRVAPDGRVYAATSPSGKVYRLGASPDATVVFDPTQTDQKPRYLWDLAFSPDGHELYVAAGAPAVVYRVPLSGGKPDLLFRTNDQHIRCLLMRPDGVLWAGTDGNGVIYRFDTRASKPRPIAAYSAARREITSLATDSAGNIYAAGVGTNPNPGAPQPGLPPLPVTGNVGVTVTFTQPGSTSAAAANTLLPEGSEIYRIASDGTPSRLVSLKEDVVYALAFDDGALLAATGNRGRIYRIDINPESDAAGSFTDVAHLEAGQGIAFAPVPGGQIVATSNSGKVYRLEDHPAPNPTYTSEVFDAGVFSRWGRVEVQGPPTAELAYELSERTGNVQNPATGWSDWQPVSKDGAVTVPPGRFAQWRVILRSGAAIDSVSLNYLEKNIAPVVDEVVVQPGARVAPTTPSTSSTTVQVNFPTPTSTAVALPIFTDANSQPLTAQKDRTAVTARWAAHDDNGDTLIYSVWYRGTGEHTWRLLKQQITDKYLSFDSDVLPDGRYEIKVIASDAPDHTDSDTLTGERVSDTFLVDTTPPVPGPLTATLVPASQSHAPRTPSTGAIHATFSAKDALSPIVRAEYSIDAGPWQYLNPVGQLSDSLEEHYDFTVSLSDAGPIESADTKTHEHVLAVRVFDREDNTVSAKTVVR